MAQSPKTFGGFQTLRHTMTHLVQEVRHLNEQTFVLRCSRAGLQFTPGQHLSVGPKNDLNMREYSIYSGVEEDFLEILVIEVKEGVVSKALKKMRVAQEIKIEGPFGSFIIEDEEKSLPLYMIATGTGVSPFHCFALSYPTLPFTLLHGVRHFDELYEHEFFSEKHINFVPCISKENIVDYAAQNKKENFHPYQGRVTDYLRNNGVDTAGIFFLCGNCDMIYEVFDILNKKGVPSSHIKAEVYF